MAEIEELIRDLLHPIKEKRENALSNLTQNWNLEFRPYLWKAIENEKEKHLQKQMIAFAIVKLKDKALRKMIRFIENGVLYPVSIREIIRAYAQYETEEVRGSLMKAILRNSHHINNFMTNFFSSRDLGMMKASKVLSLLSDIFESDCHDDQKYQFSRAITLHPRENEIKPYLDEGFRHKFRNITIVRKGVLDVKFEDEQSEKRKTWFIWNRANWEKEDFPKINSLDNYLIDSLNYRSNILRNSVLSILGSSMYTNYKFISLEQWQPIFDIWNGLFQNKLESDFIKLEDYSENALEDFFSEKYMSLYQDLRLSEIHPHQIRKLAILLLPRSLLYRLARDDPDVDNRELCLRSLKNYSFFFTKFNNNARLIGSNDFVIQILKRSLTAMEHEQTEQAKLAAYELYEFLLNNLLQIHNDDFQILKNNLEELNFLSSIEIREKGYSPSARILMKLFLNQPITGEDVASMPLISTLTIIRKFVSTIENEESHDFLLKLLETQKIDIRMQIITEIEEIFANRISIDGKMRLNITSILTVAKSDLSIKLRSYARLLLNKLK